MPILEFKHVVSFSSQDPKHTLDNLIRGNGSWLSASERPTNALTGIIKMDKASKISFIDIGNANSAIVSIEVARSAAENFESLLPSVILMSPMDARNGKNNNSVRMFSRGDMNTDIASQKWDLIKISCSQPFMRNSQFGISMLTLRSEEEHISKSEISAPQIIYESANSNGLLYNTKETLKSKLNTNESSGYSSPQNKFGSTRAARIVGAAKITYVPDENVIEKKKISLEKAAINFLLKLNLTFEEIHKLKVMDVRRQFEKQRGQDLTEKEKEVFKEIALDFACERLKKLTASPKPSTSRNAGWRSPLSDRTNGSKTFNLKKRNHIDVVDIDIDTDAKRAKIALEIECPICCELFSEDSIEAHASECGLNPQVNDKVSSGKVCPVCRNIFSTSAVLFQHVEDCIDNYNLCSGS